MYLQLAENNNDMENYMPIETNQGTIFVRRDLAEDVMLSAGGRGLKIAAKVVGGAAKFIPLPGAALIGGVASNILNKAGEAKAAGGSAIIAGAQAGQAAGIGAKLKGALSKLKQRGAPVQATALPEAIVTRTAAPQDIVTRTAAPQDMELMQPKQTFFQKYRTPILIGGGVLVLGTAAYLLTRKKKR